MTVARIPLGVAFWFAATRPLWGVSVLGIAAATDLVDGWIARRARRRRPQTGRFADAGAWLDPLCDKFFAIVVLTALALRLDVPIVLLLLIGARELVLVPLVLVYRLTTLHDRFHYDFRSISAGKRATVAQFVAVFAILVEVPGVTLVAVGAAIVGLDATVRYLARARRAAAAMM